MGFVCFEAALRLLAVKSKLLKFNSRNKVHISKPGNVINITVSPQTHSVYALITFVRVQ